MKLTNAQISYISDRFDTQTNKKINDAIDALGFKPEQICEQNVSQKLDMIYSGKAILRTRDNLSYHTQFINCFNYPLNKEEIKEEAAYNKYAKSVQEIKKKYKDKKEEAMDNVMLSQDAESALALLKTFEKE